MASRYIDPFKDEATFWTPKMSFCAEVGESGCRGAGCLDVPRGRLHHIGELARQELPREAKRFQSSEMDRSSCCSVLSTGDRRVDRQARLSGNAPSSAATRGLLLSHPPEPFTVPRAGGNERRNPNSIDAARTVIVGAASAFLGRAVFCTCASPPRESRRERA